MMVNEQFKRLDPLRFSAALEAAKERRYEGIGTLSEKTLHATLKNYFADEGDLQEQDVGGTVADIYGESGIVEIQTCGCYPLKKKLPKLLALGEDVTIVCPIMRKRTLFWIDAETAELSTGRKSPKTGRPSDLLPELFYLSAWMNQDHFTVLLFLYDGEEYKIKEPSGKKRIVRRRVERIPTKAVDIIEISSGYDLGALLPENCTEQFTAEEFSKMAGFKRKRLWAALKLLTENKVIRKEKNGRGMIYTVTEKEFCKK